MDISKYTPEQIARGWSNLMKLMDGLELTDAEVDEELREMGYDPEEIGKRMAKAARDALEKIGEKKG